jgi:hypothetical protein
LLEIEGRNRKANAMIKEKEHLISHLLQSGKKKATGILKKFSASLV